MSLLGSLVGAVGSLIGGAMGGDTSTKTKERTKSRTKSVTRSRSNLGMMVRDAKRYGFNPLTILRAGGLGAYSQTASRGVTTSKSKGKNVQQSSGPMGAAIAGAAQSVGNALTDTFTPQAATAADAWAGQPPEYSPTPQDDFNNVMSQLAGSNWAGGGTPSVGGLPMLPASSETTVRVPALTNNKAVKDALENSYPPDEIEAAKIQRTLPKSWSDAGVEVPRENMFNIEGAEGWAGDDVGTLPMVVYNWGKLAAHNADKFLSKPRSYTTDTKFLGSPITFGWDPAPRQEPVVESEVTPSGVYVPQPALTDPMYGRRIQSGYY